ncbi:MAG: hypothetical protein P0S95_07615 [Rhabdochlamydiaceae bacterium]|nr:hypothetical protein [Candidatus Amphrikana amoebophyrae]
MKKIFLILSLSISLSVFAQTNTNTRDIIKTIGTDNIEFISQDKVYLKQDNINIGDHGLYLKNNSDEIVFLPIVYSDNEGCYLIQTSRGALPRCKDCNKKKFVFCKDKNCDAYKRREKIKADQKQKKASKKKSKK